MDYETCITVSYGKVRGKAKQYPYFQPAQYISFISKDGIKKWKYSGHLGIARRSIKLATKDAQNIAKQLNCRFILDIRNYKVYK